MKQRKGWLVALAACALLWAHAVVAATTTADMRGPFVAEHRVTIGGRVVHYRSEVAEQVLPGPDGKPAASVYTISYLRTDLSGDQARPVLFAFNGGPGSSSLWLHLGLLGPRRIALGADPLRPSTTPPFEWVDNAESPLDVADIVLIDPPGTGMSRVLKDGNPAQFYSAQGDAAATVQVIEDWIRQHHRWNAPKYLLAESYGTVRAALVARLLAGGPTETGDMDAVTLNGVVLLGQALDLRDAGDLQFVTALPSLAATACFHGRAHPGCDPVAQASAARRFAASEYLTALYQGARLGAAEKVAVADALSSLMGLAPEVIERHDLRITDAEFAKLLLADQGLQLGMYDARYTLPSVSSGKDPVADDPAMGQYAPAFVAGFKQYLYDNLRVHGAPAYRAIAFRDVNARWNYGLGPGVPPDQDFALDLAIAMRRNPALRLMVGCGLYDLVTPMGKAEYTITHAGIPLDRTSFHVYPSGHMAYLGDAARRRLAADLRAFIQRGGADAR